MTPSERMDLVNTLSALVPEELDKIILSLKPPAGVIPPWSAPQGQRVFKLLEWAESPTGSGLEQLEQVLKSVLKATQREFTPQTPANPPDTLEIIGLTGVDYHQLQRLLSGENWEEADNETVKVMYRAANRVREQWLREEDIHNLPAKDLRIINRLWLDHSKGKFGFSVQAKIYRDLGGTREYNQGIWERFGNHVGWRQGGSWKWYPSLDFSINAPRGHLPGAGWSVSGNNIDYFRDIVNDPLEFFSSWGKGVGNWGLGVSTLFSRPDL